jgi:hypothetical protein
MEEKKKRVRPTVAMMCEMEDTVHSQCVELRAWREKYDRLFEENRRLRKRGLLARILDR